MKKVLTYITLILFVVIQTGLGKYIRFFGVLPNLVLTFVVVYSMTNGMVRAAVVGLVGGLFLDSTSYGVFGMNGLMLMYTALIISYFSAKFYYENKTASFCGVLIYSALYESVLLIVTQVIYAKSPFLYVFGRYILLESLINALISIPVLYWVKWLNNEYIRGI